MASRSEFTDDEWNTLHRAATGAGLTVALSEQGFTSTFKESGAMASFMAHQSTEASSQLVRELAGTHGTGWKITAAPDEVRQETVKLLQESIALLSAKAADDLDGYRAFVLALTDRVSEAGSGGEDVEGTAIATIREALGA